MQVTLEVIRKSKKKQQQHKAHRQYYLHFIEEFYTCVNLIKNHEAFTFFIIFCVPHLSTCSWGELILRGFSFSYCPRGRRMLDFYSVFMYARSTNSKEKTEYRCRRARASRSDTSYVSLRGEGPAIWLSYKRQVWRDSSSHQFKKIVFHPSGDIWPSYISPWIMTKLWLS